MQGNRHVVAYYAAGSDLALVSAPFRQLFAGVGGADEPMCVLSFRPALRIERIDKAVVRWFSGAGEVQSDPIAGLCQPHRHLGQVRTAPFAAAKKATKAHGQPLHCRHVGKGAPQTIHLSRTRLAWCRLSRPELDKQHCDRRCEWAKDKAGGAKKQKAADD